MVFGLTQPESTASVADALSTRPLIDIYALSGMVGKYIQGEKNESYLF